MRWEIPPTRPASSKQFPKRGYRFVVPIAKRPAVAVMPFVNQTADAKDEYFSDGLADELIRVLSRIEGLRVTARSVVFRFKGQPGMPDKSAANWASKLCWKDRYGGPETAFASPSTWSA